VQEASARFGWPLQVIDDAGHFLVADRPKRSFGRCGPRSLTAEHAS
jgi:hypothetical protein